MVDPTERSDCFSSLPPSGKFRSTPAAGTEGLQRVVGFHPLPVGLPRYSAFSRRVQREQREALCWVVVCFAEVTQAKLLTIYWSAKW